MSLAETYKDLYDFELSRRSDLSSALSLPTGVVSVVVGALVVMAKEIHPPFKILEQIEIGLMLIAAIACAFVAGNLINSLYNFVYAYLPAAGQLKDYCNQLVAYYVGQGHPLADAERQAEAETLKYIEDQYVQNTDRNTTNNDIKSAALHNAYSSLIVAIVFTALAGGFFVANSLLSTKEPQKLELVNLKELVTNGKPTSPAGGPSIQAESAAKQADKGGSKPASTPTSAASPASMRFK